MFFHTNFWINSYNKPYGKDQQRFWSEEADQLWDENGGVSGYVLGKNQGIGEWADWSGKWDGWERYHASHHIVSRLRPSWSLREAAEHKMDLEENLSLIDLLSYLIGEQQRDKGVMCRLMPWGFVQVYRFQFRTSTVFHFNLCFQFRTTICISWSIKFLFSIQNNNMSLCSISVFNSEQQFVFQIQFLFSIQNNYVYFNSISVFNSKQQFVFQFNLCF